MKKILALIALFFASIVNAATLVPIQLLNPAGSAAGQAIVSTGASSAPGWTSVLPTASPSATGTFTLTNAASSGITATFSDTANTGSGVSIQLIGNGATTPNKYVRVVGGLFEIMNSANSVVLGTMDDSGDWTVTGFLNPSQTAGIVGTTTNNNANAGSVGEFPAPTNLTAVSLTTVTPANLSSISLSAGDWDVVCTGYFIPAAGTTPSSVEIGVSTTSATQPANLQQVSVLTATMPLAAQQVISTAPVRISIASTTTVYCVGTAGFSGSTETANGYLRSRRIR